MIPLRQSEKFGCAAMNFIDEVNKQMGVKVVMFAGGIGEDQDLQFTQYVLRTNHCVNSLKVFLIGWKKTRVLLHPFQLSTRKCKQDSWKSLGIGARSSLVSV
jgi:hypothetical protein